MGSIPIRQSNSYRGICFRNHSLSVLDQLLKFDHLVLISFNENVLACFSFSSSIVGRGLVALVVVGEVVMVVLDEVLYEGDVVIEVVVESMGVLLIVIVEFIHVQCRR